MEKDCIFCNIANKSMNAVILYEDSDFVAFLDKFPTAFGHVLIIPKVHQANIFEADDNMLAKILIIAKKICNALKELGYEDINILQNNGVNAGQSVFHYHIHIIPRKSDDNVKIEFDSKMQEDEVLNNIKNEILKFM